MPTIGERLKNSWNAFMNRDPTKVIYRDFGNIDSPSRKRYIGGSKTIVTSVYNRIAMDVASINIKHVYTDINGNFISTNIDSKLNNCLTLESNIDQISNAFFQDACMTMFDYGVVALVPVTTTANPAYTEAYDILELRVGRVIEWFPYHVKIEVYNGLKGKRDTVILSKRQVAIIENPLYAVMNGPNSSLQRLTRVLNDIDRLNEKNSSGKLDLIIQLPYQVKSSLRKEQAEERRKDLEAQLTGTQHGIAYTDGTERIVQLNRPIENNLWQQATDLEARLYNQLGLTQTVFDGTADERTMLNYYSRSIDPIVNAFCKEMTRKFLSKTARTQGQAIQYFRDPFKLVPVIDLANVADTMIRNQILSSNEMRGELGYQPVDDPRADELNNPNMPNDGQEPMTTNPEAGYEEGTEEYV